MDFVSYLHKLAMAEEGVLACGWVGDSKVLYSDSAPALLGAPAT